MLVVTGTQRSGTSVMTKLIKESGYDVGSNFWDAAVQGGFENELICGFYREYLGDPTFPFNDFDIPVIGPSQFTHIKYEVVKFSFLLMSPVFVAIWNKFRPFATHGDCFLVMNRNKEDVISSKQRVPQRFRHDSRLITQEAEMLRHNFNESLMLMGSLGAYVQMLLFPSCLRSRMKVNETLMHLSPEIYIPGEVWDQVIDHDKVHFGGDK